MQSLYVAVSDTGAMPLSCVEPTGHCELDMEECQSIEMWLLQVNVLRAQPDVNQAAAVVAPAPVRRTGLRKWLSCLFAAPPPTVIAAPAAPVAAGQPLVDISTVTTVRFERLITEDLLSAAAARGVPLTSTRLALQWLCPCCRTWLCIQRSAITSGYM